MKGIAKNNIILECFFPNKEPNKTYNQINRWIDIKNEIIIFI